MLSWKVLWQDVNGRREGAQMLGGGGGGTALELEVGHLALDDTRIGAQGAVGQAVGGDRAQQARIEPGVRGWSDQLEVGEGATQEFDGAREAQAGGGPTRLNRRLGHERAHG